jgi:hypothetical protein
MAMSASGLAVARLIESPSQFSARWAAPAASIITGAARMRVLRNPVVLPGTVRSPKTVAVTASAPYQSLIVTQMPAKLGSRVRPGHVIIQIDGRPVILLHGTLPAYRDLHEGDSGPDVAELQAALARLGYAVYDESGYFGASTAYALLLLYENLGYAPPTYRPPVRKHEKSRPQPTAYLPMGEVSYVPATSAFVVEATAKAGDAVTQGQVVLKLATGNPYVTGMLTAGQAAQSRHGMSAMIGYPGVNAPAVVGTVSALPAYSTGSGATEYQVAVRTRRSLPQRLIGSRVRLTIFVPVTGGPVLSVPVTAVFASSAGHGAPSYVVRISARGLRKRVAVSTGPAAGGFVAVQAVTPGALAPGDHVLIGVHT